MIRIACLKDLPLILEIKTQATAHMHQLGIMQWNEDYPNEQVFTDDIQARHLYVIEENGLVVGFACINRLHSPEYSKLPWKLSTDEAFCIHRLAISPMAHGKGYAKRLMAFAKQLAQESGITSIRVDTFSQNFITQNLFKKLGYIYVGDVYFGNVKDPFYCYEKKILSNISAVPTL